RGAEDFIQAPRFDERRFHHSAGIATLTSEGSDAPHSVQKLWPAPARTPHRGHTSARCVEDALRWETGAADIARVGARRKGAGGFGLRARSLALIATSARCSSCARRAA